MTPKCECPEWGRTSVWNEWLYRPQEYKGMNHDPNECLGDYELTRYKRIDGSIKTLCSCCVMPTDIPMIGEVEE